MGAGGGWTFLCVLKGGLNLFAYCQLNVHAPPAIPPAVLFPYYSNGFVYLVHNNNYLFFIMVYYKLISWTCGLVDVCVWKIYVKSGWNIWLFYNILMNNWLCQKKESCCITLLLWIIRVCFVTAVLLIVLSTYAEVSIVYFLIIIIILSIYM